MIEHKNLRKEIEAARFRVEREFEDRMYELEFSLSEAENLLKSKLGTKFDGSSTAIVKLANIIFNLKIQKRQTMVQIEQFLMKRKQNSTIKHK